MTEIEFLTQLLLNEPMAEELKIKLIARIGEVEKERKNSTNNTPYPIHPYVPYVHPYKYTITCDSNTTGDLICGSGGTSNVNALKC